MTKKPADYFPYLHRFI